MIDILSHQIQNRKLTHAYIFNGQSQSELLKAVQEFSREINVHATDLIICNQEEKIKIAELRKIIKNMSLKPILGEYKMAVVANADNLSIENSNILLKTLEECPEYVIIILLAAKTKNILPTVFSRCQLIRFRNNNQEINSEDIENINYLIDKNITIKQKFDLINKISENNLEETINNWLIYFSDKKSISKNQLILKKLLHIKKISNSNINKKLVLEDFILQIN